MTQSQPIQTKIPKSNVDETTSKQDEFYLRLEPSDGWMRPNFGELWQYRELLFFMTWRNILVRYKQTILGAAWAIIQPFMTMVVFTLFFGRLAQIPSDGIPYPIFSYAALVPWTFFATSLGMASNSIVAGTNLIKKVYFPRLVLPISTVFASVVDFFLAFIVLILMMLYFGIVPTLNIVFLPYFLLIAFTTSLGISLLFSALNVQFRDVKYTIPFLTQILLFLTPIAYPSSLIESEVLRALYALNPMVGVVEGFRWALLGTDTAPGIIIVASSSVSFLILMFGLYYFRRMEKTFADVA